MMFGPPIKVSWYGMDGKEERGKLIAITPDFDAVVVQEKDNRIRCRSINDLTVIESIGETY